MGQSNKSLPGKRRAHPTFKSGLKREEASWSQQEIEETARRQQGIQHRWQGRGLTLKIAIHALRAGGGESRCVQQLSNSHVHFLFLDSVTSLWAQCHY